MKKILLCLTFLLPVSAFSQDADFTKKDIAKKTLGIVSSFKYSDHVGVFQINLNDTTFELVAVDDKSQLLWRASYNGYGVACGKFNNHILAISSAGYSRSKWSINPYTAHLIDEKTGKPIIEKEIFNESAKHQELVYAVFRFKDDDSKFNLIVRQTHGRTSALSAFQDHTEDISIISLDENLEPKILKPKIPDGTFVGMTSNPSGDLYFVTYKDNGILQAWRYEYGNSEPAPPITLKCDPLIPSDFYREGIAASETERNILYLGITYNDGNSDRVLLTGKLDFDKHSSQIDSEVFTGRYKRSIQKNYVPVGADLLPASIGSTTSSLGVRYIREHDGKLIIVFSESFYANNGMTAGNYGHALIINYYDSSLKKIFQQLMPVDYESGEPLESGFGLENGVFNVVSNNQAVDWVPLYGQLDLTTGKWLKLDKLMIAENYVSDRHIIWFKDSFIVPYVASSGIFSGFSRYKIRLQLNKY